MSEQVIKQAAPRVVQAVPTAPWPKDAVAYLQSKGWEPDGDPRHPGTLWLDPTKSRVATEELRVIGTRTLPNNKVEEVRQVHVTPAAFGIRCDEAVSEQLRRDAGATK